MDFSNLCEEDKEVYVAIQMEKARQQNTLELIASENFVSPAIMEAMGSYLTNKYAEGYPNARYYGGCKYVDIIEQLAIDRAKKLFGAEHANVQPHCGAQANMCVYFALLKPGDTILGMNLSHGGHLTHGSKVNSSGQLYRFIPYGVDEDTGRINYDELQSLAFKHKPKMILAGASAYPREIDFKRIREICDKVGALMMVDMAHTAGLVAAGLHQNPVEYADVVTTTTHKTLRGPRGGMILCKEQYAKAIDKAVFPGIQGGPLEHVIAAKAVCFKEAMTPEFKDYQKRIIENTRELAVALMSYGFNLVSNGTDNHLILIDLRNKGITGKEFEQRLESVGITVNKNAVPFDTQKPTITSGIRIGTPALTTRGLGVTEMIKIAEMINYIAEDYEGNCDKVKAMVKEICDEFPLY